MSDRTTRLWRQGRKVGHHVYLQEGSEPSDSDPWIGSFVNPEHAALAVRVVNEQVGLRSPEHVETPALPCGHRSPIGRPCSVCAVFAAVPSDEEF